MFKNHIILNLNWIRHAESCSNFDQDHFDDKKPYNYNDDENIGVGKREKKHTGGMQILQKVQTRFQDIATGVRENVKKIGTHLKASWLYHPPLSFIGMQQAILLGKEYLQNKDNIMDIYLTSASLRTVMTALLALRNTQKTIYVCPYITEVCNPTQKINELIPRCRIDDYQNKNLDSKQLKKIVNIIKKWLNKNWIYYHDDIEIIDNLIEIKEYYIKEMDDSKELKNIQDFINVIDKYIIHNITINKQNKGKGMEKKYLEIRKGYFENIIYHILNIDNSKITKDKIKDAINFFKKLKNRNILLPNLDYSILEKYEKKVIESKEGNEEKLEVENESNQRQINTKKNIEENTADNFLKNFKKFYKEVLPYIISPKITDEKKKDIKIGIFSHGNIIRRHLTRTRIWKETKDKQMFNTGIHREQIIYNKINKNMYFGETKKYVYNPVPVRTKYKNFERYNSDLCRLESVKGIINSYGYDKTTENLHPEFKEIIKDIKKELTENQISKGGYIPVNKINNKYYKKYIKYKKKYLKNKK